MNMKLIYLYFSLFLTSILIAASFATYGVSRYIADLNPIIVDGITDKTPMVSNAPIEHLGDDVKSEASQNQIVALECTDKMRDSVKMLLEDEPYIYKQYSMQTCDHVGDGVYHITVRPSNSEDPSPQSLRYDRDTDKAEWLYRGGDVASASPGGRFLLVYSGKKNEIKVYDVWKKTTADVKSDEGIFWFGERWEQALISWVGTGEIIVGVLPAEIADRYVGQSEVAGSVLKLEYIDLYHIQVEAL
ncbi:hypothetical protein [Rhizobium sp. LjRoot254]|uniref:hypothetical protein n=1 Tax=Rhizobium sp. LjRoot254 TaxID=3342297 RepID=UPI003ECD518F